MSTTANYQAAEQLLRRPAAPGELVVGDKVRPQWIEDGRRFWYQLRDGADRQFVVVDPAAGTRTLTSTRCRSLPYPATRWRSPPRRQGRGLAARPRPVGPLR